MAFDFSKARRIQSLGIQSPRLASQMICLNSDACIVKILGCFLSNRLIHPARLYSYNHLYILSTIQCHEPLRFSKFLINAVAHAMHIVHPLQNPIPNCPQPAIIPSSSPATISHIHLIPLHTLQLPQHNVVRIHEPIHTIHHTRLLVSIQLPRRDFGSDALSETDIR